MYKITIYVEEYSKKKIKRDDQKRKPVDITLLEFIKENYEVKTTKKRGIKGTDLHHHYKNAVVNPLGRDLMYQELRKAYKVIIHRRLVFFNLKIKEKIDLDNVTF